VVGLLTALRVQLFARVSVNLAYFKLYHVIVVSLVHANSCHLWDCKGTSGLHVSGTIPSTRTLPLSVSVLLLLVGWWQGI